jgi:hypothetical protein
VFCFICIDQHHASLDDFHSFFSSNDTAVFENFLDAVLPLVDYTHAALQPLWPHLHALVSTEYLLIRLFLIRACARVESVNEFFICSLQSV